MKIVYLRNPYHPSVFDEATVKISKLDENVFDIYFSATHQASTYTTLEDIIKLRNLLNEIIDDA